MWAGLVPSGAVRDSLLQASSQLPVICPPSLGFLGVWRHHPNLCLHHHMAFLWSVTVSKRPFLIMTRSYWIRAHLNGLTLI